MDFARSVAQDSLIYAKRRATAVTTSTLREHLEADGEDIESYVRGAIRAKDMEIEHLRLQVARLRRMKFGQSSERFIGNVEQLGLLDPTSAVAELPPLSSSPESDAQAEPARKRPVREALPDYLPRESVVHPSPCHCPGCGGKLRKIGTVWIARCSPNGPKGVTRLRDR
jgi:transposase